MKTDDVNRLIDQRQALYVDKSAHEAENVHRNVDNADMSEERVHKSDKSIHKPTAWMLHGELFWSSEYEVISEAGDNAIPLYTAPLKREWVGLTDEDIAELRRDGAHSVSDKDFMTIEAKLKEKNT